MITVGLEELSVGILKESYGNLSLKASVDGSTRRNAYWFSYPILLQEFKIYFQRVNKMMTFMLCIFHHHKKSE